MTVAELIEMLRAQDQGAIVEVSCGRSCGPAVRIRPMMSGTTQIQPGGEINADRIDDLAGVVVILDEKSVLNG